MKSVGPLRGMARRPIQAPGQVFDRLRVLRDRELLAKGLGG